MKWAPIWEEFGIECVTHPRWRWAEGMCVRRIEPPPSYDKDYILHEKGHVTRADYRSVTVVFSSLNIYGTHEQIIDSVLPDLSSEATLRIIESTFRREIQIVRIHFGPAPRMDNKTHELRRRNRVLHTDTRAGCVLHAFEVLNQLY